MSDKIIVVVNEQHFENIANAIREKNGLDITYKPREMADAISAIETGNWELEKAFVERTISGEYVNNTISSIGDSAFRGCANLTSVSAENVTSVGPYAFIGTNLNTINLPRAENIGTSAFADCKVIEATLPAAKTLGNYSFNGNAALTRVVLPSVVSIGDTSFYGCDNLEYVDLGVSATSIGANCFYNKSKNQVILPKTLIIRAPQVVSCAGFGSLSIVIQPSHYIYVPSNLISEYKNSSVWNRFISQFRAIEDYPDICG